MIYLLLSIITTTGIFLIFKLLNKYQLHTPVAITINYFTAFFTGLFITPPATVWQQVSDGGWFGFSIITGALFIGMFFIASYAFQRVGLSVASVATKTSLVIPISFSVLYYHESVTLIKIIGIAIALCALVLMILQTNNKSNTSFSGNVWLIPLMLFVGSGLVDSFIKYAQSEFLNNENIVVFSMTVFIVAGLIGIFNNIVHRTPISVFLQQKVLIAGVLLGLCNLGSLYFLVKALQSNVFDSSVIFAVNNICILMLNVLAGRLWFAERINMYNKIGVVFAVAAIILLTLW